MAILPPPSYQTISKRLMFNKGDPLPDCNVVWFRRDLRVSDNEIVTLAARSKLPTLFVFTLDPWFFKQPEIGTQRVRFLLESLAELDTNLQRLGARLHILCGESARVITKLLDACSRNSQHTRLYFNRDIQVEYGLARDAAVRTYCDEHDIPLHEGRSYFLLDDPKNMDAWHEQYYRYQERAQWHVPAALIPFTPEWLHGFEQLDPAKLHDWVRQYIALPETGSMFTGGETHAQQTLQSFLTERYHGYHWKLSRPYLAQLGATSQLSPHIAFGTISTRQVSAAAYGMKQRLKTDDPDEVRTLASFLSRIRWRDSFTQRLYFFPELIWKNRFPEFDTLYRDEPLLGEQAVLFEAWKAGKTGFPLLDASMRQLAADGWINFRMRAQAVTMLCIVFGISWHHGARYFMQQLVDGDVAINHWQWQMQAGITNPLSPTFRIYNPTKNLIERDPKLQYIHHWLPEYRKYSDIDAVLANAQPIVDFKVNKQRYGDQVSLLRKQVRERILASGGPELTEAMHMHRVTSRISQEYKAARRRQVKKADSNQISLFEAGDA